MKTHDMYVRITLQRARVIEVLRTLAASPQCTEDKISGRLSFTFSTAFETMEVIQYRHAFNAITNFYSW